MIGKQDIADRAAEWGLTPEVVEKDYVLGWLLAAIAEHPITSTAWIFKGGTSIKKCVLETFRFSEDLDFSLGPDAPYSDADIRQILADLAAGVADASGIECPGEEIRLEVRENLQKRRTYRGRVGYRGPRQFPGWPRVLVDITNDEPILDPPVLRAISHPYPDELPSNARVRCYSLEELIAEKTRALIERSRPRDLYDVVYLLDNLATGVDLEHARTLFARKCAHKGISTPMPDAIVALVSGSTEIRADWSQMLAHQLPALPSFDSVLARLRESVAWITPGVPLAAATLPTLPLGTGEVVVPAEPLRRPLRASPAALDLARFAGANRLLLAFDYPDSSRFNALRTRLVEPYSLRRPQTGNLLLYAWNTASDAIRAYNVAKIRNPRVTDTPFSPRYRIEFVAPRIGS